MNYRQRNAEKRAEARRRAAEKRAAEPAAEQPPKVWSVLDVRQAFRRAVKPGKGYYEDGDDLLRQAGTIVELMVECARNQSPFHRKLISKMHSIVGTGYGRIRVLHVVEHADAIFHDEHVDGKPAVADEYVQLAREQPDEWWKLRSGPERSPKRDWSPLQIAAVERLLNHLAQVDRAFMALDPDFIFEQLSRLKPGWRQRSGGRRNVHSHAIAAALSTMADVFGDRIRGVAGATTAYKDADAAWWSASD